MSITTGRRIEQSTLPKPDNHGEYINSKALLDGGSTDIVSRKFSVRDNPVRIIAWGIFDGYVQVQRVLSPETSTNINGCGSIVGNADTREKPYTIGCKQVKLCVEQSEIIIDSVGDYKLVYVGSTRDMLHVTHQPETMTAMTLNNLTGTGDCCNG